MDAPILADFIRCGPTDRLLEIGTGCGIIALILFRKRRFQSLLALEIQPELAALATRNIRLNRAARRLAVRAGDARDPALLAGQAPFDVALANPPYRSLGRGKLNPDTQKAIARHELHLSPPELMGVAQAHLRPDGRLFLVHLPERVPELVKIAGNFGFELRQRRLVFSRPESPAPKLALLRFERGPAGAEVLPPLYIYSDEKQYSAEFQLMISSTH